MSIVDLMAPAYEIDGKIYVLAKDHTKALDTMRSMYVHDNPIQFYESQEQLSASLKEWQHRLFLDGWIIKAYLTDAIVVDGENIVGCVGHNDFVFDSSISTIEILDRAGCEAITSPEKVCQEETLVHELLHCLYGWLENGFTYESKYLEGMEHQKLEQMARSLIMVKYDLDYDYFVE